LSKDSFSVQVKVTGGWKR